MMQKVLTVCYWIGKADNHTNKPKCTHFEKGIQGLLASRILTFLARYAINPIGQNSHNVELLKAFIGFLAFVYQFYTLFPRFSLKLPSGYFVLPNSGMLSLSGT